jgi:hypothetical protein
MPANLTADVTYQDTPFPAGTALAAYWFELVDAAGTQVQPPQSFPAVTTPVTFANVAAGTYSVRGWQTDAAGAVLGTPVVSAPISVEAEVTISIVATITVKKS